MRKANILIVEDESIIALELETNLQEMGHRVMALVAQGEKAIEAVGNERPDLVLMDVQLIGDMDGIEAATIIYQRFQVPAIFLTAHLHENRLAEIDETIPFAYLSKPIKTHDLKIFIEMVLRTAEAERKQRETEQQRQASEQQYRELTQLANSIILKLDPCGRLRFINDFGLTFFGFSADELEGESILGTIVPPTDSSGRDLARMIDDILRQPEAYVENENENLTRDGRRVWISWRNKALYDQGGRFIGILATGIDISHRRQSENDLRRTTAELKERVRELDCLFNIARLVAEPEITIDGILQGTVDLLPTAFRFPELAVAALTLDGSTYQSNGWLETAHQLTAELAFKPGQQSLLQVAYREVPPEAGDPLYLPEEQALLQTIAEMTGRIVNRLQIRGELSELKTQYQELFRRMGSGAAVYRAIDDGADFIIIDFNQAAGAIENVEREAVIGRRVLESFPGIRSMGLFDVFQRVWRTGIPEYLPVSHYQDDRIIGWRENYVYRLPSGEIVAIYDDRTSEKQAEQAIEQALKEKAQSEARFRELYHQSPDMILTVETESGHVTDFNQTLLQVTGYTAAELFDQPIVVLLSPESAMTVQHQLYRSFIESGTVDAAEVQLICADGSLLDVALKASALRNDQGRIVQALTTLRDITDRKRMERERAELEQRLQQMQKLEAIASLAGGIAHDFNNILHPIMGYTRMARKRAVDDPKLVGYLDQINRSAHRARQLIQQILTFSRPGQKDFTVINPKNIVKEVLYFVKASLPSTVEITSRIDKACGYLTGNPIQLHQVLMNLVTNAYQALEDKGGTILVELKPIDPTATDWFPIDPPIESRLSLKISDTGDGIDEALLTRIFEPYFTTKDSGKGTGLGLATVLSIVKRHGGDIQVSSRKGMGTTFHIILPAASDAPVDVEADETGELPVGTEHILLVDDEYKIVAMEKEMLEDLGYRTTTRTGSIDALEAFKTDPGRYDLLLTDMTMPNMDGAELAAAALAIRPDLPVIICTGYSHKIDATKADILGVRKLLYKPVPFEDLARAIRQALDA
jgi:PAS domain S-box-containing protein